MEIGTQDSGLDIINGVIKMVTGLSSQELDFKIKYYEMTIQKNMDEIDNMVPNSIEYYNNISSLASDQYQLGQYYYLSNNTEKAIEFFINASENFYLYNTYDPWGIKECSVPGIHSREWVESAIFSDDKPIINQCSLFLLEHLIEYDEISPLYHEDIVLLYYLQNNLNKALNQCKILQEHEVAIMKLSRFIGTIKFIGRVQMINGLINCDENELFKGCISGLKRFSKTITRDEPPLCTFVLKYLVLFKRKGNLVKKKQIPTPLQKYLMGFIFD